MDRALQMQRQVDALTAERLVKKAGLKRYSRMSAQQKTNELTGLRERVLTLLKEGCYS